MKKFLALALALVMICALSVTCFAANIDHELPGTDYTASKKVTVSYAKGDSADDTYVVDVTWESLSFTYLANKEWDAESHIEVDDGTGRWQDDTANIIITNHSNVSVWATVAYQAGTTSGNASFALTNGTEEELVPAEGQSVDTKTATLTASGVPATTANNTEVGTVTVTIAAAATPANPS